MPSVNSAFLLIVTLGAAFAAAAEPNATQPLHRTTHAKPWTETDSPIGVGLMGGNSFGTADHAAVLEGQNHFNQRRGEFDLIRYGEGQTRVEIGNGLGFTAASTGGVGVMGLQGFDRISPFVGLELFNARLTLNTHDARTDFYGWYPMLSAGPQIAAGTCRVLPVARGGAALGNLGKSGILPAVTPAYGASAFLNCWRFDAMAEWTRAIGHDADHDLGTLDTSWRISPNGWKLGLRAEALRPRAVAVQGQELRGMILVRGAIY